MHKSSKWGWYASQTSAFKPVPVFFFLFQILMLLVSRIIELFLKLLASFNSYLLNFIDHTFAWRLCVHYFRSWLLDLRESSEVGWDDLAYESNFLQYRIQSKASLTYAYLESAQTYLNKSAIPLVNCFHCYCFQQEFHFFQLKNYHSIVFTWGKEKILALSFLSHFSWRHYT